MPSMKYDLDRFHLAQRTTYKYALEEIKQGQKRSCWMWFIFPQVAGLGMSDTACYYSIEYLGEAKAYIADEILAKRLVEISRAVLAIEGKSALEIFGGIDAMKLKSSMTLFELVSDELVFGEVLDKYFDGERDTKTLELLDAHECRVRG